MRPIAPRETLMEQAYKAIKASIVNNEVQPGDNLAEERIASQLGISRTPIREALKRLAFEGLVELKKGSKAKVSSVTPENAYDYQLIRERLESMAAGLASRFATAEDVERLTEICVKQKESIDERDYHQFIELDYDFHSTVADISQNEKLKEFIENLYSQIQRFLILTSTLSDSAIGAVEEHYRIIEAIKSNDPVLAEHSMEEHIKQVTRRIINYKQEEEVKG
ncbi:GntR family transcriptional regulator [Bacillus sp. SB49]|uniref:GntR family transcriptional regulator n=1 Tax=Bacillus sp. SB49 TaxID=1071080 RepID=UPI0003F5D29D|nr:GntR family transcriptional regulator [Bacillus sp. SB49]QHT48009.1 GntR family transcriptional regulator [Bacillus sp. SB49]